MAGIYIHIPFCKHKCYYCNFYSVGNHKRQAEVVQSIIREMEIRKDYLPQKDIQTIYFGGGTPSLLSTAQIMEIIEYISMHYSIDSSAEITLEANPDDLSPSKVKELQNTPVNRLSIGIQSFFSDDLEYLHRTHNAAEAQNCIQRVQDAGFSNLSLDLIYGIPTLTEEKWHKNLDLFFATGAPHLSAYSLTVEPATPLEKLIQKGKRLPTQEEESLKHFDILLQRIQKEGFTQYEISNFCKDNTYSRHNKNYWNQSLYLGVGPSAHSFDGNSRQWNTASIPNYLQGVEKGSDFYEKEILDSTQCYNEYIMTSLRTIWGCSKDYILKNFGEEVWQHFYRTVKPMIGKKQVVQKDNNFVLSNQGKVFADGLACELFL
ncbi:MAG: radical SAM family heme chaperone HemW [Bacteroidales bacterium]